MDDMQAIEQRIAGEMLRRAGPSEPVDDLAIFDAVASRSHRRGFTMFSALKLITAAAIVALFGGFLLSGVLTTQQGDDAAPAAVTESPSPMTTEESPPLDESQGFPTGTFVATDRSDMFLEFNEDGTGRVYIYPRTIETHIIYAVHGDLWTEMAGDSSLATDRNVPATYYWDYDGELLSFELLGEELNPGSRGATMGHVYRLVPDPREALVAAVEIPAGEPVYSSWATMGIVPAAEAGPDAFTDISDVMGRIAAVTIAEGQPITPNLLEPPAE